MPPALRSSWSRSDLTRPGPLLAAIAALVVASPVATVIACNIHEVGHAGVATILGWEVERIDLCLPSGGGVVYARVGRWAGNVQGYAGGFAAAIFLIGAFLLVFAREARPLRGPGWWFAGLGVVLPIGPQVVNGVLEGAVPPGADYTQVYAAVLPPLVILAMVIVIAAYSWWWRNPWRRSSSTDLLD